jgi:DNA-binding MarR family transcriptional regulator
MGDRQRPEPPRVRASDPVTSREAAASIDVKASSWPVLAAAAMLGVFHDEQLAARTKQDRNIVARRRKDLEEQGYVERRTDRFGVPVTAIGGRGRSVMVFEITPAGIAALQEELERRRR